MARTGAIPPCAHLALLLCAVIAIQMPTVGAQEAKGASVSLLAKWPGTSLVLETTEFMATGEQSTFWDFLHNFTELKHAAEASCWSAISAAVEGVLTPGLAGILQQALSSRQLTAKVSMLQSLADRHETQGACCTAFINGQSLTTPQQLTGALKGLNAPSKRASSEEVHSFDHIYSSSPSASLQLWQAGNATAAILYGTPGSTCFQQMHKLLTDSVASQYSQGARPLVYAVRPVILKGCQERQGCSRLGTEQPLQLAGYGVEMAIKNMEYSALDDSQVAAAKQAQKEKGSVAGGPEDVKGFLMGRLLERRPELEQELLTFQDHLLAASASADDDAKLKVWDLKDLGLQASQRILQASDPLRLLTDISQNFPSLASALSRLPVNVSLAAEVKTNQRTVPSGMNLMLLNGLPVDGSSLELYPLLDKIAAEVRLSDQLTAAGLPKEEVRGLMQLRAGATPLDPSSMRIDLAPYQHVHWLNDLEKDRKRYRGFSKSVADLLVPTFPGSLPSVARNLFNAVFIVDLASEQGLRVAEAAVRAINSRWPIRIGIMPVLSQSPPSASGPHSHEAAASAAALAARAVEVLGSSFGSKGSLALLTQLAKAGAQSQTDDAPDIALTPNQIEDAFVEAWEAVAGQVYGPSVDAEELELADVSPGEAWQQVHAATGIAAGLEEHVLDATELAHATGLVTRGGEGGSLWLNGLVYEGIPGGPQQALMRGISEEMRVLQEHVYFQNIRDDMKDILAKLLQLEGALPRYNPRILEKPSSPDRQDVRQVSLLSPGLNPTQGWLGALGYLYPPGQQDSITAITHWICIDPDTQAGQGLLLSALQHISRDQAEGALVSRIGILYNPSGASQEPSLLSRLLLVTSQLTSRRPKIAGYLTALLSDSTALAQLSTTLNSALELAQQSGLNLQALGQALDAAQSSKVESQLRAQAELTQTHLQLTPGSSAVVTNGRVVVVKSNSLGIHDAFSAEDFSLLDLYASSSQLAAGVQGLLESALTEGRAVASSPDPLQGIQAEEEELTVDQLSNSALLASAILASHGTSKVSERMIVQTQQVAALASTHCTFTGSQEGTALLHVEAVLNPLSKAAQHMAPILEWLRASFNASVKVYLNPERELSDMPLKTFYRYVLPEPSIAGQVPSPPGAVFKSLPPRQILTLNFDAPEMWLVEPVVAQHDLDNLRLDQLGDMSMMHAQFELEALMLTGRCIDAHSKRRDLTMPRGVQLHLGSPEQPHLQDTLVMSNLGYFQLKAAPGAWTLQLAPGRSRQLYYVQGQNSPSGRQTSPQDAFQEASQTAVAISSLQGKDMLLRITKRKGYELEDVLEEPSALGQGSSLWGRLTSWATKPSPLSQPSLGTGVQPKSSQAVKLSPEDDPNTIHIFTVASGHMYERLQKIMILSVIRNTRNPVKFWFIKNYMSPQMKRFVPEMADRYKFHYQFVTYKWPSFLHKQTEKQRLIWAYKILFLDVLFPLNLRKVIFCDSDQVIRGDMAELWNMDLKGAPFGFTPFCDNNKDMEGFRFWKQGFWKEHLRGKPYHISALFVVDLQRFRRTAAGDQLRMVYDQLSKDPNSLSNLDQDLPNYAQHSVPIFSLPMEWLWCETWCGNATKQYAKTIDLCNNPLTKEPKLQGARRIVAEWPGLDEEARAFTQQLEKRLGSEAVALEGIEQPNSRVIDPSEVRHQHSGGVPPKTHDAAQSLPNSDQVHAENLVQRRQQSLQSRHDADEL